MSYADEADPYAAAPTAVLDPPAPTYPPPVPAQRSRRGMATLLTLALLGAGATGGGVATLFDRDSAGASPVAASVSRTDARPAATTSTSGTAESAAAVISPSVVTIAVTGTQTAAGRFGQQAQSVSGTGSGIVLRADGYIVTNNHVVSAAGNGGSVTVTFSDGRTVPATIVGRDPTSDLAVIRVSGVSGVTPAVFADSEELKVGQAVLAVGAPLGLSNTVTEGIVSTLHRPVRTGEAGATEQSVIDAVQTDAAINPGNSGGALVDLAGHVVGINSAIATTGESASGDASGNIGVGFSIPSNDAAEVADELIANGRAVHPQLGVSTRDATSSTLGTPGPGATVTSATGGAAAAGLRAGDVLTKIDDRVVTDADSLIVAVRAHDPADVVTVTYTRGGTTETTRATLGTAVG